MSLDEMPYCKGCGKDVVWRPGFPGGYECPEGCRTGWTSAAAEERIRLLRKAIAEGKEIRIR